MAVEVVQLVADLVRRRKCVAPPRVVSSLLGLRFSQLTSAADAEGANRSSAWGGSGAGWPARQGWQARQGVPPACGTRPSAGAHPSTTPSPCPRPHRGSKGQEAAEEGGQAQGGQGGR